MKQELFEGFFSHQTLLSQVCLCVWQMKSWKQPHERESEKQTGTSTIFLQ